MSIPSDLFIGGLQVHLYSVCFAAGALAAYLLSRPYAIRAGIKENHFDSTVLMVLVFGIAGARLFYVAGHWQYFSRHLGEVVMFWQGGLAFYGGLIGGFTAILLAAKLYKFELLQFLDAAALGLPVGQAIGRLGNFFNQEAFGKPTDLPWGIYIDEAKRPGGYQSFSNFHPTFFYEGIGLVLLFVVMWLARRRLKPGLLLAVYAVGSGILRALIETIRVDALVAGGLKISLVIAIVLVLAGSILGAFRIWKTS